MSYKDPFNPAATDGELLTGENLASSLRAVYRSRWIVLTITLMFSILFAFYAVALPKEWTTYAQLVVGEKAELPDLGKSVVMVDQRSKSYYETQVRVIKSVTLLERVTANLDLVRFYYKRDARTISDAVRILTEQLYVDNPKDTHVLSISFTDRDPAWAAKITNELIEVYIEHTFEEQRKITQPIFDLIEDKPEGILTSADQYLSIPFVSDDPNIKPLKDNRTKLQLEQREQMLRYTPEHPQRRILAQKLTFTENEIRRIAVDKIKSLKTRLVTELKSSGVQILERAEVPATPSSKPRSILVLAACLVSFMGSSLLVIFLDFMDKTIKDEDDLAQATGLPVLAQIPRLSTPGPLDRRRDLRVEDFLANPQVMDAFTTLKTTLAFSMPKGKDKRIMVTSTLPHEGKSTLAYLLAISMARLGKKVLFVELDLRKPSLKNLIRIPVENAKGIDDYVENDLDPSDVIFNSKESNRLDVVAAVRISADPSVIFTSDKFSKFFQLMDERYDHIVIDAPPAYNISDVIVISEMVHGIIFVVGSGKSGKQIVVKTLDKLKLGGCMIYGSVFNMTELQEYPRYL